MSRKLRTNDHRDLIVMDGYSQNRYSSDSHFPSNGDVSCALSCSVD